MKIHRNPGNKEEKYYVPALCIAILAFLLYEGKLRYRDITLRDMADFLKNFIEESYGDKLEYDEAKKYTVIVLDNLQNYGNNFKFRYYSYETRDFKEKFVKLIECRIEDNSIFYSITKDGLDFFLKTKEFPEESRITINLLLFRKQISSGAFDMALETLNRLNVEVQKKLEKKNSILDLMVYGGRESTEAYREYYISVEKQFQEEKELFNEVKNLIIKVYKEYIGKFHKNITLTKEEEKTFNNLKEIQHRMDRVIESHFRLLKEASSLSGEYEKILNLRRQASFSAGFDFNGEFSHIADKTDRPEALKFIVEPLFMPYIKKIFNPVKIFSPQKLISDTDNESYEESERSYKVEEETLDETVKRRVSSNFRFYGLHMLRMFEKTDTFTLTMWIEELVRDYGEKVIFNADFIAYIIELNHGKDCGDCIKEFRFDAGKAQGEMETLFKEICEKEKFSLRFNSIQVQSEPDKDIELNYGIKVNNLMFRGI